MKNFSEYMENKANFDFISNSGMDFNEVLDFIINGLIEQVDERKKIEELVALQEIINEDVTPPAGGMSGRVGSGVGNAIGQGVNAVGGFIKNAWQGYQNARGGNQNSNQATTPEQIGQMLDFLANYAKQNGLENQYGKTIQDMKTGMVSKGLGTPQRTISDPNNLSVGTQNNPAVPPKVTNQVTNQATQPVATSVSAVPVPANIQPGLNVGQTNAFVNPATQNNLNAQAGKVALDQQNKRAVPNWQQPAQAQQSLQPQKNSVDDLLNGVSKDTQRPAR